MPTVETTTFRESQTPTVAIIEPDSVTRDSLVFLLESVGLKTATYESSEDFLTHFTKQNHVCLISEISLPGIDALELINKLRQLDKLIPTIILTHKNDVSMAVSAIHAGAVDFIEKPFVEPKLLSQVLKILDEHSQEKTKR